MCKMLSFKLGYTDLPHSYVPTPSSLQGTFLLIPLCRMPSQAKRPLPNALEQASDQIINEIVSTRLPC
jgi:hypothetical protein